MLTHEGPHKSAAPSVRLPIDVKARAAIGISEGYRRHGVRQLGEWRIEGCFVAAEVIFVIDRAGLYGCELSGSEQGYSMMLRTHHEFHGRGNYLLGMTQKFTAHLVRKRDQRQALLLVCLVIHYEDSLSWVGIGVGITQSGVGVDRGGDAQAVERNTVPASALNVPCEDGLVADEVHFAIGETLAGVDVGTPSLDVVAANLAECWWSKSQKSNAEEFIPAMPHRSPRTESVSQMCCGHSNRLPQGLKRAFSAVLSARLNRLRENGAFLGKHRTPAAKAGLILGDLRYA